MKVHIVNGRDILIDVLDFVLEQQLLGRRPTDQDVAEHFKIPLADAVKIHDMLEEAGEFE